MAAPGDVRYARTHDGIDVAYMVTGEAARDVVVVHGFTTHLDLMWDVPWYPYWTQRLGEHFRVIQFDKRGTGLSDRSLGLGSIEDRARDILAVMDACGSEQASIVGISEGGPMALAFAALNPGRVDRLVLYGSMARVLRADDYPDGVDEAVGAAFVEWIGRIWGTGEALGTLFMTHAPDPEAALRTAAQCERNACTPQMAQQIMRHNVDVDVRPVLAGISAPTLVMHVTDDPLVQVAWGRYLGEHVPDAEYFECPGDFHCTWRVDEFEPFMERAVAFLVGGAGGVPASRPPVDGHRVVSTVLFTDIVGSTELAAELGDGAWREILEQHDRVAADRVARSGGRVVKSTGDGLLAVFDGPSRAILSACETRAGVAPLGLKIRAGVHVGEIERRGDDIGGIGVHIAARVAALAGADEVLVTRTVRDLTMGSGLEFHGRGRHALKGIPEDWDLYAVNH
ncbi:MAG: adenylate/guanylate cyclase domain-containing protein [Actinobacteria bacterium]|nr:adenylate/guanylate cyclase domain-containing protein [Actinomycetota bacterium]